MTPNLLTRIWFGWYGPEWFWRTYYRIVDAWVMRRV